MKVLMVSKALVVGMYQRKLEELAALPDVQLTVAVPPYWREKAQEMRLERSFDRGYQLKVTPMRFNGHYHVHYYPQLDALLDAVRPDILHFDEEPYNLSTWLALRAARHRRIPLVFYSWQNIMQRYPPPFRWLESDVLNHSALGLAGSSDAATVLREKGFAGPIEVVPQFGIDPELFTPPAVDITKDGPLLVGFVGRLVEGKGLQILLRALADIPQDWQLDVIGTGPTRDEQQALARSLGIEARVRFLGQLPSTEMPARVRQFDLLVAPSLTTKRWKEQFGRMLVEAMACEVPVIGSDSGEIPGVVGDAGLIVPEGDVPALRQALERLFDDPHLRGSLGSLGRQRALARFTQAAVARQTYNAYRRCLGLAPIQPSMLPSA